MDGYFCKLNVYAKKYNRFYFLKLHKLKINKHSRVELFMKKKSPRGGLVGSKLYVFFNYK